MHSPTLPPGARAALRRRNQPARNLAPPFPQKTLHPTTQRQPATCLVDPMLRIARNDHAFFSDPPRKDAASSRCHTTCKVDAGPQTHDPGSKTQLLNQPPDHCRKMTNTEVSSSRGSDSASATSSLSISVSDSISVSSLSIPVSDPGPRNPDPVRGNTLNLFSQIS